MDVAKYSFFQNIKKIAQKFLPMMSCMNFILQVAIVIPLDVEFTVHNSKIF